MKRIDTLNFSTHGQAGVKFVNVKHDSTVNVIMTSTWFVMSILYADHTHMQGEILPAPCMLRRWGRPIDLSLQL